MRSASRHINKKVLQGSIPKGDSASRLTPSSAFTWYDATAYLYLQSPTKLMATRFASLTVDFNEILPLS